MQVFNFSWSYWKNYWCNVENKEFRIAFQTIVLSRKADVRSIIPIQHPEIEISPEYATVVFNFFTRLRQVHVTWIHRSSFLLAATALSPDFQLQNPNPENISLPTFVFAPKNFFFWIRESCVLMSAVPVFFYISEVDLKICQQWTKACKNRS